MTQQIPLTKGKFALVDDEDYERVSQYKWCCGKDYAIRSARVNGTKTHCYMHRFIMDTDAPQVDHINGDKLDNRRCNLRPATPAQNQANSLPRGGSSKYKGVHWDRACKRWVASMRLRGRPKKLGKFKNEEDAALAYDKIALATWGEFAYLNFPNSK